MRRGILYSARSRLALFDFFAFRRSLILLSSDRISILSLPPFLATLGILLPTFLVKDVTVVSWRCMEYSALV